MKKIKSTLISHLNQSSVGIMKHLLSIPPGELPRYRASRHCRGMERYTALLYALRGLLYYTGITRVAKSILGEIVRGMFLNAAEHLAILEELKLHAAQTYETLMRKAQHISATN